MKLTVEKINELRGKYGEAFYLLDSEQFRKNFIELKEAFSSIYSNFNIAYSYKTNYTPKLCKIVDELGGYAEVVSEMEMDLALRCGVNPEKIIWNGPIKNPDVLRKFLLAGGTVNIDSIDEAEYIQRLAIGATKTLHVGIRCNYDVADGVISRFGFDIEGEDFKRVLDIVLNTRNLYLNNFQCHFAKRQITYWPARAKGMIAMLDKVGIIPDRIDIGGGLFGKMEDSLKAQFSSEIPDYNAYAEAVAHVFADRFKESEKKTVIIN